MDEYLIIVFPTQIDAQTCLDDVNNQICQYWQQQGYTVINGQIVGKSAATGQDDPSAAMTISWDEVKESPDSTFYFSSPHNDARFSGVTITGGAEVPFPLAWQHTGDV